MTKYERELATAAERLKRAANIRVLQFEIDERKNILAVMPNDSIEEKQDRQFIRGEIAHYSALLEDEQRAYDAANTATDSEVNAVVSNIAQMERENKNG